MKSINLFLRKGTKRTRQHAIQLSFLLLFFSSEWEEKIEEKEELTADAAEERAVEEAKLMTRQLN